MFKISRVANSGLIENPKVHLRLWQCRNNVAQRRFMDISKFKLDERGKIKLEIDPRVRALQNKIIYCDYIESKKLKLGYVTNKKIEKSLQDKVKYEKIHDLLTNPASSIVLKLLDNNNTNDDTIHGMKKEKVVENVEKKPIYMPYAHTDEFQTVADTSETADEEKNVNTLDEQYKKICDQYIVARDSAGNDSSPIDKKLENLRNQIYKEEQRRPVDSLDNIPSTWMTDYEEYNDTKENDSWQENYGTPNPDSPVSSIPCGGCGASLHCQDSAIPGYLPSEIFDGLADDDLKNTTCQRCHFMKFYNTALEVSVSPDVYPEILRNIKIKSKKVAVLLLVDLTDVPCSIWPGLTEILGRYTNIFVVGNKVDLLPKDCPHFIKNIHASLEQALHSAGILKMNVKHTALISAKTGYGVDRLINKIYHIWGYKGDVYMIGCTNVGKSTLFNAFLQSDYCKVHAVDLVQRATTSPWPGTTLNLLKFPIFNPTREHIHCRVAQQKREMLKNQEDEEIKKEEFKRTKDIRVTTLSERIERSVTRVYSESKNVMTRLDHQKASGKFGIDENSPEFKNGKWCYDTPGVIHPDQILHFLTTEELLHTLPKQIISPRSFVFKPGQTLFLAGLGRLDFIQGPEFIRITVFASAELPITMCLTADADYLYDKLIHTEAFKVPVNDPERLKIWPKLEGKEFTFAGINKKESAADIVLSSSGWIALTPDEDQDVTVKGWTPEGRGIYLRIPAMLKNSVNLRGARRNSSLGYKSGRQVYVKH